MTFARFVTTPENRAAVIAVQRVDACLASNARERLPNPLYLHGPAGTGKSLLASALVDEVGNLLLEQKEEES